MGEIAFGLNRSNKLEQLFTPAAVDGQALTQATTENEKSIYTTLSGSIPRDCVGFMMCHGFEQGSAVSGAALMDIAVDDGTTTKIIVPDQRSWGRGLYLWNGPYYYPLGLRAGDILKAAYQAATLNGQMTVTAYGILGDPMSMPPLTQCKTYGIDDLTSRGTYIDHLNSATKTYYQVIAATTDPIRLLRLIIGDGDRAARVQARFYVEPWVGGDGGHPLVTNFRVATSPAENIYPSNLDIWTDLPAGVELGVKVACNSASASSRDLDVQFQTFF